MIGGSNLVAYWNFDEVSGTAADSSGNSNTATLVNGPLRTKGIVGNALSFDGVNDNVTVLDSNSLDLSSGFTLSAWVNPTVAQSNFTAAISKNSASDHVYFLYASSEPGYCGDTGPLAGANLSRVQRVVCSSSGMPLKTWSHNCYLRGANCCLRERCSHQSVLLLERLNWEWNTPDRRKHARIFQRLNDEVRSIQERNQYRNSSPTTKRAQREYPPLIAHPGATTPITPTRKLTIQGSGVGDNESRASFITPQRVSPPVIDALTGIT